MERMGGRNDEIGQRMRDVESFLTRSVDMAIEVVSSLRRLVKDG